MTAQVLDMTNGRPYTSRKALYVAKWLRDNPMYLRNRGQLWQRVAEGKRNADLVYPFYKRRHLLGMNDD